MCIYIYIYIQTCTYKCVYIYIFNIHIHILNVTICINLQSPTNRDVLQPLLDKRFIAWDPLNRGRKLMPVRLQLCLQR